ncbi:MAG: hypothetical protein ACYS0I_10105 [Planctomycetota bacterium]
MKCLITLILISVYPFISFAGNLQETKSYRLNKTVSNLKRIGDKDEEDFTARRKSIFIVVDASNEGYNVVRFSEIKKASTVSKDDEYKLFDKIDGVDVSKSVRLLGTGPVSGPLIVPFKFRLEDDSITGEATLGYYAGYRFETLIPRTDFRVPISPFAAGGISQVSVTINGESDTKSAFTWAVGILIQNWANVNIGIVYGEDRTGDKDWEHEGEGWFSFMIGWDL